MRQLTSVPTIDVDQAATITTGSADTVLLDVREQDEWDAGHAPHARHIPLGELPNRLSELPRQVRIACVCRSGNRSAHAVGWLLQQGFDAVNVSGGMQRWVGRGLPVVDQRWN